MSGPAFYGLGIVLVVALLDAVESSGSLPPPTGGLVQSASSPPEIPRSVSAGPVGLVGHCLPDHHRPGRSELRDMNARGPSVSAVLVHCLKHYGSLLI